MPIKTPGGILEVEDAKLRASYLLANTSVGIGTSTTVPDGASLYIKEDDPTIRFQEGTATSAARILAKSGTLRLESGTDYDQPNEPGDIAFSNIQGGTTHMIIKGSGNVGIGKESPSQMLDVSGNVQVGTANLFVDTTTGRVGVGVTDPGHNLDIVSEMNLRSVSNTASIKYNSNVVTEYVRSKKLIKYPRVAMTSDSYAGYILTSSTDAYATTGFYRYKAFNNVVGNEGWHAGEYQNGTTWYTTYDSNGYYDSTSWSRSFEGIPGEWLQIQLPEKIKLSHLVLKPRQATNDHGQAPKDFTIYGSNNGSTWTSIGTFYNVKAIGVGNTHYIDTQDYYRYITILVTRVQTGSSHCVIGELEYYGTPEYDPEAHGTGVIMRSVPNVPNTDWLEVYYDAKGLSDGSISTVDDLTPGGTKDGTATSVTVTDEAFTFTSAATSNVAVTIPNASGEWIHSVSLWVKADEVSTTDRVGVFTFFRMGNESTAQMIALGVNMDTSGNGIKYDFYSADVRVKTDEVQPNKWMHFVVTYSGGANNLGGAKKIYLNGKDLGATGTQSSVLNLPSSPTLYIGGQINSGNPPFSGSIANFRLFNRALTADEVWQLYAYQKDYFQVSPDVVTFKGGRLGIGTSEPQAVLDVMGDVRYIRLTPRPAVSARQLFLNGTTQDGVYPISGVDGGTAYPVYCRMNPQYYGGFWMCFAQIPINTNGPINFFSDTVGNSGDLLATNFFSVPVSILSKNAYGTDIDVLLELDGGGMRRTIGNKVGGIWRGIYLSQAFDTAHTGTVSTSTHAYTADGISWTNGDAATFTKANSSWNVCICVNGGDYSYNDYNEGRGGWLIHEKNGYDLGSVYGRAMRGNDAIDMSASTDWAVARIFVRPTQT